MLAAHAVVVMGCDQVPMIGPRVTLPEFGEQPQQRHAIGTAADADHNSQPSMFFGRKSFR